MLSMSSLFLLPATVATVRMKFYESKMAQSHGNILRKWQKQATLYVANPPASHQKICQAEDRENLGHSVTLKRYAMQVMGPQSSLFAWLMHGGESHLGLPQLAMHGRSQYITLLAAWLTILHQSRGQSFHIALAKFCCTGISISPQQFSAPGQTPSWSTSALSWLFSSYVWDLGRASLQKEWSLVSL